ncbi:MAG TPA: class I SAM-dependent methyltransferase [Allosphingosinicella sp.]|jgi:SAM-dependent methyltransferase|nr:class I SAM-dependent methyltransferase [Allosphingosinicella sp.]
MKDDTRRFYDVLASVFDELVAPDKEEIGAVLDLVPTEPGRALDVGVGTGRFAIPLARRGWQVDGLDFSGGMLDRAGEAAKTAGVADKVRLRLGDVRDSATLPAGPFNLILGIGALFHLPDSATIKAVLSDLRDRLAPGGTLLVDFEASAAGAWAADPSRDRVVTYRQGEASVDIHITSLQPSGEGRQRIAFAAGPTDRMPDRYEIDVGWMPVEAFRAVLVEAGWRPVAIHPGWAGGPDSSVLIVAVPEISGGARDG